MEEIREMVYMADGKLRGRRREEAGGSGDEPGCNSQRGVAGAVGDRGVVVRETDGKRGRWGIRAQMHSNPNFFKSDGHGKMWFPSSPCYRLNGMISRSPLRFILLFFFSISPPNCNSFTLQECAWPKGFPNYIVVIVAKQCRQSQIPAYGNQIDW